MTQTLPKVHRSIFRLPDSLFGQLLCILFLGIVILQAANFWVVCRVQALYVHQAEKSRADNLVTYWSLFNSMPANQRDVAMEHMAASHRPEGLQGTVEFLAERPDWKDDSAAVKRVLRLVEANFGSGELPPVQARAHENKAGIFPMHLPVLEMAICLADGNWLKVTQPFNVDDRNVVWLQRLFVLVGGVIMLGLTAILLLRVTRPIRQLSEAAESFGKHPELSKPFAEKGVKELRDAAQSFNRMRERICGNLAERDRMIAAMAHDLRTPLTRLQLRLDRIEPESLRQKLQKTASDMRAIISQGLEFARSLNTEETIARLDLRAFLQSMVDDFSDVGNNVTMVELGQTRGEPIIIEARPLCLRRCVENLVSNACKYGGGAEVSLAEEKVHVVICVEDRGPGIPEDMLDRVFEPYFRLETSRNRSSGGIGLGLAIARNMAILNNGEIELKNRPEGGLMARILLPGRNR